MTTKDMTTKDMTTKDMTTKDMTNASEALRVSLRAFFAADSWRKEFINITDDVDAKLVSIMRSLQQVQINGALNVGDNALGQSLHVSIIVSITLPTTKPRPRSWKKRTLESRRYHVRDPGHGP
jgi:hypothetical protein